MVGDAASGYLLAWCGGALLAAALLVALSAIGRRLLERADLAVGGPGGVALGLGVGAAAAVQCVLLASAMLPLGTTGGRLALIVIIGGAGLLWLRSGPRLHRPRGSAATGRARLVWIVLITALLPWAVDALAPLADDASLKHHLPLAYQVLNRGPLWVEPFEHHLDVPAAGSVLSALLLASSSTAGIPILHFLVAVAGVGVVVGAATVMIGPRSAAPAAALGLGATAFWVDVSTAGPASMQLLFGASSLWLVVAALRDRLTSARRVALAVLVLATWAGCGWSGMVGAVTTIVAAATAFALQRRWQPALAMAAALVLGAAPWWVRNGLLLDDALYGLWSAPPMKWGPLGSIESLVGPLWALLTVGPPADPALAQSLADTPLAFLAAPSTSPSALASASAALVPLVGPLLILPVALMPFAATRGLDRLLVALGLLTMPSLLVVAVVGGWGASVWPAALPLLVLAGARAFEWWREDRVVGRALAALMVMQLVATFAVGVDRVGSRAPLSPLWSGAMGVDRWRCEQATLRGRGDRCFAWGLRKRGVLKAGEGVWVIGGADPQRYLGHVVIDDHDGVPFHRFWRRWISVGGDADRLHAGLWRTGVRLVHVDLAALHHVWRTRPIGLGGVDRDRMVRGGAVALLRFLSTHATRLPGVEGEVAAWRLQPLGEAGGQRRHSGDGVAPGSSGTSPTSPRKTVGAPTVPSSTR
jgi:hypothetical protein